MSLPWFPFNIKDFVTNTLRLNTEAKGAYLMLILDYYQTETAPPNDDEVLAAITGLSIETWQRHRRVIAPLFQIRDHQWTHDRVQQEILDGHHKHAKAVERARVASEAAASKRTPKAPKQAPTKEPNQDNPPSRSQHRNHQGSNDGANVGAVKDTPEAPQTQTQILAAAAPAQAREPVSVSEIEDQLTGTQPVSMGVPIDHWTPDFVHPNDLPLLNVFCAEHEERGTFSKDWPTLWRKFLDEAKTPPPDPVPAKPKRRTVPPRVETNKRPEAIPGVRILISEEAFAVAKRAAELIGVVDQPVTIGMPGTIQTWMASWPPEIILTGIERVMARRKARGEYDPPTTMKYFENGIASEFADRQRPVPVATIAKPQEITTHGRQRPETKSLSAAADRLIERLTAGGDGGTADGRDQGQAVAGAISDERRG